MTRGLVWAALGAAVVIQSGCNDISSNYYLIGSCLKAAQDQCTETRTNTRVASSRRTAFLQSEESDCTAGGGVYHTDETCPGVETAERACVTSGDDSLAGNEVTLIRSLLYLSGYSSPDGYQTEQDQCESSGGEFRDTHYVPPPAG